MSPCGESLRRYSIILITLLVLIHLPSARLAGQVSTATLSGTVKDQTQAVLPGVAITLLNVDTGASRAAATGSRGEFHVAGLGVGSYEVRAELAGFQTAVRQGITLNVGQQAAIDFVMQVGNVAEQVTVSEQAPLIDTTTASVGGVINSEQMRDIPLNSRSFIELVALQSGAVLTEAAITTQPTFGFGKKISVSGTRDASSSFLLDGANINNVSNSAGSAATTVAGVETVREFRVITNAYDAEYGRHTGGVVSAVTKSGTNQLHGSLFEFLRNDNLDAPRWEDNSQPKLINGVRRTGVKPEFKRNQFGAAVGGPIIKDRTFFFGSYEGLRERQGQTTTYNVPGNDMRQGIIPLATAAACTAATVRGVVLSTLPNGNVTCQVPISPAVQPYLLNYPLPTTPAGISDGIAQFARTVTNTVEENFFTGRIDHRFSDNDFLFGRFVVDNAQVFQPGLTTGVQPRTPNRFIAVEETHLFTPQLLGRARLAYNRTVNIVNDLVLEGFRYPNDFWSFDGSDVPGRFTVTGLTGWGGGTTNPKKHVQNLLEFNEDFNFTAGRHAIKFGGHFERIQLNERSDFNSGGTLAFSSPLNFLIGTVNTANFVKPGSDNIRGWRQNLVGLYWHDDLSVRPGLTLNLGVRYEFVTTPKEVNGKVANVRNHSPAYLATVRPDQTDIGDPYIVNPSLLNFAPRMGLAWTPFPSGKTSVRGGFGIFHEQYLPNFYITTGIRVAPFYSTVDLNANTVVIDFPRAYFTQVAGRGASSPQADTFEFNIQQPAALKWSLDLQQEIGEDMSVGAGYSGTRGTHLVRGSIGLNTTPAIAGLDGRLFWTLRNGLTATSVAVPLSNTNWGRFRGDFTDGDSFYHSLRASFNKRFSAGLQFQASYTFSKSLDTSSSATGGGNYEGDHNANFYRMMHWKGPSAFDLRNSFYTNFTYDFPGRSLTGATGKLLGGWSTSGVLRLNAGTPINLSATRPTVSGSQVVNGSGPTVDLIPGGNSNPNSGASAGCGTIAAGTPLGTPNLYFDPCQFSYSGPETFGGFQGVYMGNLGRNSLITPGIANLDITLMKETRLAGESTGLQFRLELFNLLNRPNFAVPSTALFNNQGVRQTTAGQIRSTRLSPRQLQLALKLVF